jgi:hypothetical protein
MRNLVRASTILGALCGVSGALALAAAGCGGDDSNGNPDAQADTPSDSKGDHTTDTKNDVPQQGDSQPDTLGDTETDGGPDVMDASDANSSDAPGDAPPDNVALFGFPHAVDLAYCTRLASCCGDDGGTFNITGCTHDLDVSGGAFGNIGTAQLDSGNVTYVPSEAKKCLDDTATIACGSINATDIAVLTDECAAAIQGKFGSDAGPCSSSFDCQPTLYCASDGGVCAPLNATGQPCTDVVFSSDCSYLGNGTPPLYCSPLDGGGGTCQPQLANGTACSSFEECQSLICDFSAPTADCSNTTVFSDKGTPNGVCTFYPPDSGM